MLPYNDVAAAEAEFADRGDDIACVLVEPMLGSGGCIPGDPAFLAALRRLTTEHGAVLIFDEVMTSRLAVGGAQSLLGVTPDMTTLGKYLAGGLSFGAFGGRGRPDGRVRPRRAAGSPTAARSTTTPSRWPSARPSATALVDAAALAAVNERGDRLRDRAAGPARRPRLVCVTGWGSILNVHPVPGPVTSPADLADADPRWRELFFHDLLAAGFYLAPRGYMALSMDVSDDDTGRFLAAVERVLRARPAA